MTTFTDDVFEQLAIGAMWEKAAVRVPYGRVVHAAIKARVPGGHSDGYQVVKLCDSSVGYWWADSEIERLGLLKGPEAEITCAGCVDFIRGTD